MSFLETSFLWFEAVLASTALAAALAVVGVYTVLRRVVFLPAALSQLSGLGVVLAFLLGAVFPGLEEALGAHPEIVALVVTLAGAMLLGWIREPRKLSREAFIGVAFIASSALIILMIDRSPLESHEVDDILYGSMVIVERSQMWLALAVAGGVLALHASMHRPFLLASFDPETARAHGVPVRLVDALLFLSMGLVIAIATRVIGALPVFAFSVLPGLAALRLVCDTRAVLVLAAILGAASAFFGYWASSDLDFPTGACTAVVAALPLIPALVISKLRKG